MTTATNGQANAAANHQQVAQQLALLGYKKGDTVCLRSFYPSNDPRRTGDKGRKEQAQSLNQLIQLANEYQSQGRGVYLVVNSGGHDDKNITFCRAIFYEHDNLEKDISRDLWQALGLFEPTFQVDTGGKSIHSYWVLSEPTANVAAWRSLQRDLLEYADADRSLKNPSRVMRLAGCWHFSANNQPNGQSTIIANSGKRYSFEELRAVIPQPQPRQQQIIAPLIKNDVLVDVPLEEYLRPIEREWIANGVGAERNTTGATLARNLIGTSARLSQLGEKFNGDPRQLFDHFVARCAQGGGWGSKEADGIWKSAEKDNPAPALSDDALITCGRSWRKRNAVRIGNSGNVAVISPTAAALTLNERIKEIIERGLKSSEERAALLELAKQTNTQPKEIEAIANLLRTESDLEEGRNDRRAEISELLKAGGRSLNIADFLPRELADPIKMWCGWLNIPEAVALTALLTTASTLHPVGTELVMHRSMDFFVPPILFSAVVGESGQKKSPVYKTLIKKPLRVLQSLAQDNYKREMAQYERDEKEWEKNPEASTKPVKPGLPVYFFTDATGEGIKTQAQEAPNKAMFALIDELAGLFNSSNQYRGGKGSDRQDMLSYYDGLGQTVLRAAGIKVDVENIYLSIFGGIQPDVLKEHTKDLKDADGHWARFLFVSQPLAASELPDDDRGIDFKELLAGCYRRIASLPKQQYTLSRAAFKRYQPVYKQLEQLRVNHSQPGMRAIYSKMEGAIGRLALNLHAIEIAMDGSRNDLNISRNDAIARTEISLEAMNKAIALAEFYIEQIKAIHADSRADKGELPALLAKLLEYANTKGVLTPLEATRKFNAIKTSPQALEHFRELESMGYGAVEKQKRNWVFIPVNCQSTSRNGLESLPSHDFESSRNDLNISRNDFSKEESLPSNDFESSRNERNERNDLSLFLDNNHQENLNGQAAPEKIEETIAPIAFIARNPETLTEQGDNSRNGSRNGTRNDHCVNESDANLPLQYLGFSLQDGDRVRCYPTLDHASNNWEVTATVADLKTEMSNGKRWVTSVTLIWTHRGDHREVKLGGGSVEWIVSKV
ncbi:DUF3987 domain-containing protein [Calothrix sp. FACHB-156]|nr:DUF3987 domain-containing protein [Calothrix sp. FACHB-156]